MIDPCPPREQLTRLIGESRDATELEATQGHVAGCGVCQAILDELTSEDPDRSSVQRERPLPGNRPSTEHGSYLDRLKQAPPTWVVRTKDAGETVGPARGDGLERQPTASSWPTIPGYEIRGELGRGGMGVIYLAHQLRTDRLVAIKMIQNAERGRPENLLRFSIEGENLARLQHPNIVQIYEVGTHDGQPFLSMEFVEGGSLAQAIARRPPTWRQAASLVETLARAVHAAHQSGIIHRDLKPANVLLSPPMGSAAEPDGTDPWLCAPKIADFGLAKRLDGDSRLTDTGQILGTPSYMAPEQASIGSQVGVPADVYALGAIAYELISGRPPFRCESSWETMMQVVHQPATRPSHYRKGLARDLETICLKCLEKLPEKRYASADALAEDLRRHLADEPIAARPVGPATRLVMWCRRKPAMASLAAALLLVFLAGFAGVTTEWIRADRHYREAREQERRAAVNYRLARDAVDDTMTRVSENRLFSEPGMQDVRKELLSSALGYYREFVKSQSDDPSAKVDLMRAYARLGRITKKIGSVEDAKSYFLRGLECTQSLAAAHPDDAALMTDRTEILIDLSGAQFVSRQVDAALRTAEEAVAISRTFQRGHTGDTDIRLGRARGLMELGSQLVFAGDLARAESSLTEAAATLEGLSELRASRLRAQILQNIGDALARTPGRVQDAVASFRAGIEMQRSVARDETGNLWDRGDLASNLLHLADFLVFLNQLAKALELIQQARDLLEPLVRENPRATDLRYALGLAHYVAGSCLLGMGRHDEALASYQHALDDISQVARENPTEDRYQSPGLAGIHLSMGEAYRSIGDLPAALRSMRAAQAIQEKSTSQDPKSLMNQVNLAMVDRSIGNVQAESGAASAAVESAGRALAILKRLQEDTPKNIMILSELYQARLTMGASQRRAGHPTEALNWYREAEGDLSELSSQDPSNVEYQSQLGLCRCRISALERAGGRMTEAVRSWEQADSIAASIPPDLPDRLFILAMVRSLHVPLIPEGGAEGMAQRREEGDKSIEALKQAVAMGFKNAVWLEDDPDLEPIRTRTAFRDLVRSLRRPPSRDPSSQERPR
jgi:eukaryotic-like serine/threonine-protein kinase